MGNLKDEIIEKIKAEVFAEVSESFTWDFRERLKIQIRNEIEEDLEYEEAQQARSEIAREVYERESEEIKAQVRKDIWERYEPIREHTERTLEEFKSTLRIDVESMVAELKESIRRELKADLRIFVEKEFHSYCTAFIKQILRDEIASSLLEEPSHKAEASETTKIAVPVDVAVTTAA